MKNLLKPFILSISLLITFTSFAQRLIITGPCPNPSESERAQRRVEYFLKYQNREDDRIKAGAENESIEQIRPVVDETICNELNKVVNQTPKYKKIDENLDPKDTKYYYRTDNVFYIFWIRRPEYETKAGSDKIHIHLGPRVIFLVISSDFQNVHEFYY